MSPPDEPGTLNGLCCSCYTVVIKYSVPSDDSVAMPLLFGYLGLLNTLLLLPVVLLVALLSRGAIFDNLNLEVLGLICAGGLANNVVSDYLWAVRTCRRPFTHVCRHRCSHNPDRLPHQALWCAHCLLSVSEPWC